MLIGVIGWWYKIKQAEEDQVELSYKILNQTTTVEETMEKVSVLHFSH